MHLKTWLRIADLKDDEELKSEDRTELIQAAEVVKRLLFAGGIPHVKAAHEMAHVCGLTGSEVERWRQEQNKIMARIMIGFRRGVPDTVTLPNGTEHKAERLGDIYKRLASRHGVKARTIKDWVRERLR